MTSAEPSGRVRSGIARLRVRLDGLTKPRLFLVVSAPLFALYLATATWTYPIINDAYTNAATAWSVINRGTVYLEDFEGQDVTYGFISWIVPAEDSIASKYPPGAALVALPAFALWPSDLPRVEYQPEDIDEFWRDLYPQLEQPVVVPQVPIGPAAITAALATAIAMGLLALTFRRLGGSGSLAVMSAYLAGLGTSAWPVAADQLWQHGPAMAWIALALLLSEGPLLGSGLAYGAAILTRPHLAVIAAGAGLGQSWKSRSWRPVVLVGLGALAGLAAFLAYNWVLFGEASISAGYGPGFQDRALSELRLGRFGRNIFDAMFSREVGIFIWSPFLLVLLPGLRAGWRAAPGWARGAALGGIAYLLLQYKANSARGGDFIGYRYPLEALVAAAPVLFLAYKEGVATRPPLRGPFALSVAISVTLQGLGAFGIGPI
ncbi:MAG: hypothetical protein ACR2OI_06965 [Acidimicrobiia bacterium]